MLEEKSHSDGSGSGETVRLWRGDAGTCKFAAVTLSRVRQRWARRAGARRGVQRTRYSRAEERFDRGGERSPGEQPPRRNPDDDHLPVAAVRRARSETRGHQQRQAAGLSATTAETVSRRAIL